MIRVNTSPRKKNAPRPAWKVATAYHQWLRGRPCHLHQPRDQKLYGECWGKVEAAHTPDPGSKGVGTKAADHNAIPLCQGHHKRHTDKGWSAIGMSREQARAVAAAFWSLWKGDKGDLA